MKPNFTRANRLELTVIAYYEDCPKHLKDEAKAELRRHKRNPNIKYVEKR